MSSIPAPADLNDPLAKEPETPGSVKDVAKVKPMYDRIMVRRINALSRTKGGIIIPETAKEKPIEGIVVAVGHGKYVQGCSGLQPLVIKEGDRILFGKTSGTEVIVNEVEMLILREDEVLSIVLKVEDDPQVELMSFVTRLTDRESEAALLFVKQLTAGTTTVRVAGRI